MAKRINDLDAYFTLIVKETFATMERHQALYDDCMRVLAENRLLIEAVHRGEAPGCLEYHIMAESETLCNEANRAKNKLYQDGKVVELLCTKVLL